jgi:glycosyltransferase involved in cell wall biosynthesis
MASIQSRSQDAPVPQSSVLPATPPVHEGAEVRVLHYLCSDVRGGIEEHVISLLTRIRRYGFRPYLAAPRRLLDLMDTELAAAGIVTFAVRRSSLWDFRDARGFVQFLRGERIALVNSHLFAGSIFASPLARMSGVPAVIETFHLPEVWRASRRLRRSFWIDRQVARCVDHYIAVSEAATRHLTERKRIPRGKVRTILNGRDLARFHPRSAAERRAIRGQLGIGGWPVVVVTGRLEAQKGLATMLEAAAILARSFPSLRLLFAGSGSLKKELAARCAELELGSTVSFLGYRSDPEALLAAADVAALPSLYEGLPLAAIEALAAGCPLVATNIEGTREVVEDQRSGVLVEPGNGHALARGIERVARSPILARRLAMRGRRRAEERFDLRDQIESTVALYRDILAAGRARGASFAQVRFRRECGDQ